MQGGHPVCGHDVQVPRESAMLDFVFSDREGYAWDNNDMRDFHTKIEGKPSVLLQNLLVWTPPSSPSTQRPLLVT